MKKLKTGLIQHENSTVLCRIFYDEIVFLSSDLYNHLYNRVFKPISNKIFYHIHTNLCILEYNDDKFERNIKYVTDLGIQ